MKKYKTVIFDWDNCLARTGDFWVVGMQKALESYNLNKSIDYARSIFKEMHKSEHAEWFSFEEFRKSKPTYEIASLNELFEIIL